MRCRVVSLLWAAEALLVDVSIARAHVEYGWLGLPIREDAAKPCVCSGGPLQHK